MEKKDKLWIADTNYLYDGMEDTIDNKKIVLMSTVRQEVDNHKTSVNPELRYKARKVNRFVFNNYDKFFHDIGEYNPEVILGEDYSKDVMDNRIVACAVQNNYGILTNDLNLYSTAKAFGIEVETYDEQEIGREDYTGYKEVYMLPDEHQDFYTNHLDNNKYELLVNEYLIILDDISGEPIDALKWDGKHHVKVRAKNISSRKLGKLTAKDFYQMCAIDSLRGNKLTMLTGKAGSAKTLFALSYAMNQLEEMKSDKLIVFANSLPTRDAAQLGLYKGSLNEKLLQVSIGHILASKFGDYNEVEAMMTTGELLILPLSDLRGFDATGMNAQILITEAQNMSVDLMTLAISRVGEDSNLIIEGDWEQQLDSANFEGKNNGMRRVSEVFRGENYYGEVKMKNVYRSKIADKAQEM